MTTEAAAAARPVPVASPLLSVLVPSFNSAALLPGLLESLAAQTWRGFELVLSDGGSNDGTPALVQAAAASLPAVQVDSRPDGGVYDAINRGWARCRGDWVLVLGSDDRLHASDTLARAADALQHSAAALVYGDVRMMAANTNGVPAGGRYAGPLALEGLVTSNICQQSIFYRRGLHAELGGFDLRYKLHADWDFNLRAAFRHPLQWIDLVVADYAATGMSAQRDDLAFSAAAPEWLRAELWRQRTNPALRPLRRRLLRQADALRRRGDWGGALRQVGTWLRLRLGI